MLSRMSAIVQPSVSTASASASAPYAHLGCSIPSIFRRALVAPAPGAGSICISARPMSNSRPSPRTFTSACILAVHESGARQAPLLTHAARPICQCTVLFPACSMLVLVRAPSVMLHTSFRLQCCLKAAALASPSGPAPLMARHCTSLHPSTHCQKHMSECMCLCPQQQGLEYERGAV